MGFTAAAMQVFGFFSCMLLVSWLINTELQLAECFTSTPGIVAINGREDRRKLATEGRMFTISFNNTNANISSTTVADDVYGLCSSFSFFLFHFLFFIFGTAQLVFSAFPIVWLMSFRKGVSRLQRPGLATQEPTDILESVFPAKFFDVSGTRYRDGWRFSIRCKITDKVYRESVRKKNLDDALEVLLNRYGFVAQAASGLVIDVILLAVAIYNHYYLCGRKGFGLHLACVHFIRGRYPDWCETDFTLGNLHPVHQQAIQAVLGFHGQNNGDAMRCTEIDHPNWRHEWDDDPLGLDAIVAATPGLEPQGLDDSAFWKSLVKVVSVVIAVFGVTQHTDMSFKDISKLVSAAMRGGTLLTISTASEFISEVRNIFTTLKNFWSSGWDFATFFDCNGELREIGQTLAFIEIEHNELANKLDCDLTFQLQAMLAKMEKCRTKIGTLYASHPSRHADIRITEQKLKVLFDAVTLTLVNSSRGRVQPFAISLVGGSSIGKSSITDWILHQFAADSPFIREQNHLEDKEAPGPLDMGLVYRSTLGNATVDQYLTGLFNSSWAGVFDDVCVTNLKTSQEAYASLNSAIIKILNIFPYRTEQAALENKGKVFCNFQCVVFTSNVYDFCAYQSANCPPAILRRAGYFIEPVVKPEFRINGSAQLDANLVERYIQQHEVYNGQPLPLHTFNVWIYRVGDDGRAFTEDVLCNVEIDELMKFLRESWNKHARNEVGRMKRGTNVQYCTHCRAVGAHPETKVCQACTQLARNIFARQAMSVIQLINFMKTSYAHTIHAPFFEEYVKLQLFGFHPIFAFLAIFLESYFYMKVQRATWRDRIFPVLMHSFCTIIGANFEHGYFIAVVIHSSWNSFILGSLVQSYCVFAILTFWLYVDTGLPYFGATLIGTILPLCCEKGFSITTSMMIFCRAFFFTALAGQTTTNNRAMIVATQLLPEYAKLMSIFWLFDLFSYLSVILSALLRFVISDKNMTFLCYFMNVVGFLVNIGIIVFVFQCIYFYRTMSVESFLWQRYKAHISTRWTLFWVRSRSYLVSQFNFVRTCTSRWKNRKMLKALALVLLALGSVTVVWYATQLFSRAQPQGASMSQPVAMGKNFWNFSFGASSLAASPGTQPDAFERDIHINVVRLRIGSVNIKAFCVEENFFICSKHELSSAFGSDTRAKYEVVYSPERRFRSATGVVCQENISHHPTKDLAIIQLPNSSSLKKLTQYFLPDDDLDSTTRLGEGKVVSLTDRLMVRTYAMATRAPININYASGAVLTSVFRFSSSLDGKAYQTMKGDCGSVMYSAHRGKCAILGIHIAGSGTTAGVLPISAEDVMGLLQNVRRYRRILDDDSQLMSDLSAQGKSVLPGHHRKCPLAYMGDDAGTEPTVLGNLGSHVQRSNRDTNFIIGRFVSWWANKRILPLCPRSIDFNVPFTVLGKFTPPSLTRFGWIPKFRFCDVATDVKECLETTGVRALSEKVFKYYMSNPEFVDRLREIRPLTEDETVNGIDGAKFVKSMNMRSSAGFPHKGTKKELFTLRSRDPHKYDIPESIRERIAALENRARSGIRPGVIFTATYKDEPVSCEKTDLPEELERELENRETCRAAIRKSKYGKIRVFQAVNVETTFVVRKYYLALVSLIQEFGLHTGIAVGTNCFSKEWAKLMEHLVPDGWGTHFICGDFSSYDQRMGQEWLLAAWSVLRELLKQTDYYKELDPQEKREYEIMLDALASDIANPTTLFFGDILRLHGTNASGHPLTVIINGIANLMYMIYAFESVYPDEDFFEKVRVMTYGDDNILNVHESCPQFTQPAATKALAQINVMYTASDKGCVATDYVDKPSFLKRSWRYTTYEIDGQVHTIVTCPIEFATIQKMLSMETKKSPDDLNNRIVQVLGSMLFEFIQYGRCPFEQAVNLCEQFCKEHNLEMHKQAVFPSGWPSYDEYMRAWVTGGIYTPFDPDPTEVLEC